MTRLTQCGAEIDVNATVGTQTPDGVKQAGTVTRDTSVFRSGLASWKFDSTGANAAAWTNVPFTKVASRTYFSRCYVRAAAAPSTASVIMTPDGTNTTGVRFRTDGALELIYNNVVQGSASAAITDSNWHRLEMKEVKNASSQITDMEVLLDGVSVATTTGQTAITGTSNVGLGWVGAPGASKVLNIDDVAVNDNQGSNNTSYPGSGKVILMLPISDNARGAWTAGAGGTTNLFDAVNNTPPVGVSDSTATNTSQIKNKTTTNPTNCDLNLDTYTNAGIGASDTINAIILWIVHGEDPTTGTKTGSGTIVSNPAGGTTATFNFGNDQGTAQGTYFGFWAYNSSSSVVEVPSVTLGTAPVIRATCTSGATATRAASVCFLGIYVEYTPAEAVTLLAQPCNFASGAMLAKRLAHTWRNRRRSGLLVPDLWLPSPAH